MILVLFLVDKLCCIVLFEEILVTLFHWIIIRLKQAEHKQAVLQTSEHHMWMRWIVMETKLDKSAPEILFAEFGIVYQTNNDVDALG